MSGSPIKGIVAASITPVTATFDIDLQRLEAHIAHLLSEGCSYISTFGTTGEGASFGTQKKLSALRQLADAGVDMSKQLPAIMTTTLDDAASCLVGYSDLKCRAALVLPPFYYGTSEDGVAAFFDELIRQTQSRTEIDIVLYNIPQLSGIRFTPTLVEKIVKRHGSRIVGIKDSTGDLDSGMTLVKTFPQLSIFTGDDRVLPVLVRNGGAGMIGGMPNVFARDLRALYDSPDDARILDAQSQRIAAVDAHGSLVALKAALAHYRGDDNYARAVPPLLALDAAQRASLISLFDKSGYSAAA